MHSDAVSMRRFPAAPWATLLKAISATATLLLLGVGYAAWRAIPVPAGFTHLFGFGIACIPIAVPVISLLFIVRGYVLEGDRLLVQRLLWSTPIDINGLSRVWHDPNGLKGSIRVFGNGGLFSFTGVYWNKSLGRYRLFGTDPKRFVVMQLPRRIVVVTPENPDAFIQALTAGSPLAYKDTHESTRRHAQGSPNHQAE